MGWERFMQLHVDDVLELLLRPGPGLGQGPAIWPIMLELGTSQCWSP